MPSSSPARALGAAAHLFVADLEVPRPDPDDLHHLARVLRLRPGEAVSVSDGEGRWRPGAWTGDGVEPTGEVRRDPRPAPRLSVAFVPVKGDRPEWVVQKLTEVGVDRIVVTASARAVVRWDGERGERNVARLRKVAREAAMQSRRTWLPEVEGVLPLSVVARWDGAALADPEGAPPSLVHPTVVVGPEGGWSSEEKALDLPRVALAPTVLRSETAAVAAGVLLCGLRYGSVRPI